MQFRVLRDFQFPANARDLCLLVEHDWDDWFRYETSYILYYLDSQGEKHRIGTVKIGQTGMGYGRSHGGSSEGESETLRRPNIPRRFTQLPEATFFSLGQDADYYENLNNVGTEQREQILSALRDVAFDSDALALARSEHGVSTNSIFRFVSSAVVEGQYRRIALGGAKLSRYEFSYTPRESPKAGQPPELRFEVVPRSQPPSNIHVVIGRNGVGKTRLLNHMSLALMPHQAGAERAGTFEIETDGETTRFGSLVSVSFSAFDSIEPLKSSDGEMKYAYVGLKRVPKSDGKELPPKAPSQIAREFSQSVRVCLEGERQVRWQRALQLLEADPVFADAAVGDLAHSEGDDEELRRRAVELFGKLSSGHKIVLHTITRLVESVEERSLVLLDEPEAHLHPPLLSALIRALSDLLTNRNGVAIIATHSPVVLQEVPNSCVWILQRSGLSESAFRPRIQTFGENVGTLTHEVFGLEVTKSGFHRLLNEAVDSSTDFDAVVEEFDGQLGGDARGIVRALFAARDAERDD